MQVVGVDYSPPLLDAAARRVTAVRGSAFSLPFPRRSYDANSCMFVLDDYDAPTKLTAIDELVATTRSGGIVVLGGYAPDDERMGRRRAVVFNASGLPRSGENL